MNGWRCAVMVYHKSFCKEPALGSFPFNTGSGGGGGKIWL